jgi:hypothetical protein
MFDRLGIAVGLLMMKWPRWWKDGRGRSAPAGTPLGRLANPGRPSRNRMLPPFSAAASGIEIYSQLKKI